MPNMSILLFLMIAAVLLFLLVRRIQFARKISKVPGFVACPLGDGIVDVFALLRIVLAPSNTGIQGTGQRMFAGLSLISTAGVFRGWMGPLPHVIISSPELAESILSSNEVIRKGMQYSFLSSWIGTGLLTSWGEKWKRNRKLLTPSFHFKILEQFVPVMSRNGKILTDKLEAECRQNDGLISDLRDKILLCTLDVISETAMGKKINAQSDPEAKYVKAVHEASDIFMDRVWKPWTYINFFFNLMPYGRINKQLIQTIHSFTDAVIVSRKEQVRNKLIAESYQTEGLSDPESEESLTKRREPFMDTLIREHLTRPGEFTDLNIREEVDTFMFEGHDTTGWGVIWTTFLLGLHPEEQERVQNEVDALFQHGDPNRDLTLEELKLHMPFTEAVVKEAQRLYPSVPLISRVTENDVKIGPYDIPSGVQIIINVYAIHRDKNHWTDPERFIPDRFMSNQKRHPYAYIPFSAGPRNCIGQKFALLEEKALVAKIFRKFKVTSLDARDIVLPTASLILKTDVPIRVKLQPRILMEEM